MKKTILLIIASLMISSNAFAQETPTPFQAVHPDKAIILQEGEAKMFCAKCTTKLSMSHKTNHVAHVDTKIEQYCSIHCLAETIAEGKKVTGIKVVDTSNLKFISIINSWYVLGSDKASTKGSISKYAFGHKDDAEKFAEEFGGKVMTYYAVIDSVKETLVKEKEQAQKEQALIAQKPKPKIVDTNVSENYDRNVSEEIAL